MKMKDCCATNAIMRWRWCPLVVCSCARRATAVYGEVLKTLDFKAKTTCQQGDKQKQCKTSTWPTRKYCTTSRGYDETDYNYVLMNCILYLHHSHTPLSIKPSSFSLFPVHAPQGFLFQHQPFPHLLLKYIKCPFSIFIFPSPPTSSRPFQFKSFQVFCNNARNLLFSSSVPTVTRIH